ncbi:MAG: hypothetical protein JWL83_4778 [Actinomycetia bacterium]|nr:hypothetical protein [Actinomycetes bacterium]
MFIDLTNDPRESGPTLGDERSAKAARVSSTALPIENDFSRFYRLA